MAMNWATIGIIVFVCVFMFHTCAGALYGNACTDDGDCTEIGQVCSNDTCGCDTAKKYNNFGSLCIKALGSECSSNGECNDIAVICYESKCACASTHYDNNGATPGGSCIEKSKIGDSCMETSQCEPAKSECTGTSGSKTCTCMAGYYSQTGGSTCTKRYLDQSCSVDSHCSMVTNGECSSGTCSCKTGYFQSGTGNPGTCTKRYLDQSCSVDSHCSMVTNGECSSGTCSCKTGYFQSGTGNPGTCTKRYLDQSCSVDSHCSMVTNGECSIGTCSCKTGYFQSGTGNPGTCTKRYLDQSCSVDSHCSMVTNGECSSGTCSCKTGYFQSGTGNPGTCTKRYLDQSCSINSHCSMVTNGECSIGTCSCKTGFFQSGTGNSGTCKKRYLDQSCSVDSHCSMVTNGECSSGTCSCKTGYFQSGTGNSGTCTKRYLDQSCSVDSHCSMVTNGECSSGTCSCKTGYFQSGTGNSGTCTKRYLDQSCSVNSHCSMVTNGECSSGTCSCKTGYFQSGTGNSGTCTKRELGQTCEQANQCSDTNSECNGKCQCHGNYYDDNGTGSGGACIQKVSVGGTCPLPSTAVPDTATCSDNNAKCSGSGNTYKCQCGSAYYDNMDSSDRKCELKNPVGDSCPTPSGNVQETATCSDSNAICRQSGNNYKCQCISTHYDTMVSTDRKCERRRSLGAVCINPTDNLYQCSDASAKCTSSSQSSRYTCTCNSGYHEESTGCVANKALGESCNAASQGECSDPAALCTGSTCTCDDSHYDNNGWQQMGGTCSPMTNLQVTNMDFTSIQTNQITVSWSAPAGYLHYISGYIVKWRPKDDNSVNEKSKSLASSDTTTKLASGIDPGRAYNVTIVSENNQTQDNSIRSTSVSREQAAKPSKPGDITNSELDARDRNVTIEWAAASGVTSMYKATLLDGETEITSVEKQSRSATFYNSSLKNGYSYVVHIKSKSQAFEGNYLWSDIRTATIKTDVQEPTAPRSVSCSETFDESIALTWEAPEKPNGDLVKYYVDVYATSNMTKLFTNDTDGVVKSFTIKNLNPGTLYTFKVFTQNEQYKSAHSTDATCQTRAKLSDPPKNLRVTDVTSRNFTVSWEYPEKTYSEEIYGYVIQTKKNEECVKEVVYNCSNCQGSFQYSNLTNMCDQSLRVESNKTKAELSGIQTQQFMTLLPDTIYTILATAVNSRGKGNVANIVQRTSEEVPQKPKNILVSDVVATSVTVAWSIAGPRPGKTSYRIKLTAEKPADDKDVVLEGFNNTSVAITDLQEYWNYTITVTASTSIGSSASNEKTTQTKPAAPGKVSLFRAENAPNNNYKKLKIMWKAPEILEKNSVIKEYSFKHNASGDVQSPKLFSHDLDDDNVYSVTVDVIPEEYYSFEVYAINEQAVNGATDILMKEAVAGVPINIEKTLDIEVIPVEKVKNKQQESFTMSFVQAYFEENTNGKIQVTGLMACAKSCKDNPAVNDIEDFNSAENWNKALPKGLPWYRVTSPNWLDELKNPPAAGRRKRDVDLTEQEYTVGKDACTNVGEGEYCNGPLQPDTQYMLVAVACTNGGCLISEHYGPFITLAVPDEGPESAMIIGIVVGVVVVLAIGAVVGFILMRRRRRGPARMKSAIDSDDEEFSGVDPAIASIRRKRPIVLNDVEDYVQKMHRDTNLLFSAEYEELKTVSPKHSCEAADREENRMRNRYINIIPFDHSRVKLSTNGEDDSPDYINANYLPGYNSPREYIGCQGPIPGTIDDFWRMLWEQNVSVVVMLTLCKEGQKIKCEQYWPDEVGEPKQYGDVIVEITSYSNIRTYDYRMFKITNGNKTRVVKHFHFLSWLDFQANVHHDIILDFIQHVRQHVQPPDTSGPMIVHCSAGVGRTGTYIALDHLIQLINEHDFDVTIDIFEMVLKLRENRMHMVQTEQQYVFIHDAVKEIMDRKRRQMENIYENQAFSTDENIYQNESLYANVAQGKAEQNTEL